MTIDFDVIKKQTNKQTKEDGLTFSETEQWAKEDHRSCDEP